MSNWKEEFYETISNRLPLTELDTIKIEQFITDLRKQDEAELIKILPELTDYNPVDGGYKNIHKLIKDYYAK
jgi:hypothetical protein